MLAEVQARLEDQVDDFASIDDAASFAAVSSKPAQNPVAYVIPIGEQASRNQLANAVSQELTQRFGVVIATTNRRERRGGAAARDVEALALAVRQALAGWQPTADHDPVDYASGRIIAADQGWVWWLSEFVTRSTIQGA